MVTSAQEPTQNHPPEEEIQLEPTLHLIQSLSRLFSEIERAANQMVYTRPESLIFQSEETEHNSSFGLG